ncbi:MAG: exodeoxyribonuclease VII small subunit [Elusimicrobiales bacterium]|nr:exodeoxyribonuclease VII small subunit [Elusimicrobiales bacterium]MCK5583313.1 exodeoxyribonuclease VII small subunit [Elusimicrobiales bacterium]
MAKKEKNFDFEKNLTKLENIVEKLESEDTPIEKSLEFFEEGVKISKELSGKLDEVKRKIEVLKKDASGIKLEEYEEE